VDDQARFRERSRPQNQAVRGFNHVKIMLALILVLVLEFDL
jgi:hypothetical protein